MTTLGTFSPIEGTLSRRIFSDSEVYSVEVQQLFRESWLFAAFECQVREPSFLRAKLGPDEIILVPHHLGHVRAFLNLCPIGDHRVLEADSSGQPDLFCKQHRLVFDEDGVAEPGIALDCVPSLVSYRGMIFGSLSATVPPFEQWLGDALHYLDDFLDSVGVLRLKGMNRSRLDTNWKVGVESRVCGDRHRLSAATDSLFEVALERGCMIISQTRAQGYMPESGAIFPNLTLNWTKPVVQMFNPLGPTTTELHTYALCSRDRVGNVSRAGASEFSPGATASQDERVFWEAITAQSRSSRARETPIPILSKQERWYIEGLPGAVASFGSALNQRQFYECWNVAFDLGCGDGPFAD